MKRYTLICSLLSLLITVHAYAQTRASPSQSAIDINRLPSISAFPAYKQYIAGKAVIIHAGGQNYSARHILGSLNLPEQEVKQEKIKFPKLPRKGIEIFIYCY